MKKTLIILVVSIFIFACSNKKTASSLDDVNNVIRIEKEDLMITGEWYPATDGYGSSFSTPYSDLIVDGVIEVEFEIAKKVGDEWPYIELICSREESLVGLQSITLEYKCDKSVAIKLAQSDFAGDGDQSYAMYYIDVPASEDWVTKTVYIKDFDQPSWAPPHSRRVGLKLENVNYIYLVPNADYQVGEKSTLFVRSLVIE